MSGSEKQQASSAENEIEYETETDEEPQEQLVLPVASKGKGQRKTQRPPKVPAQVVPQYNPVVNQQMLPAQDQRLTGSMGGRRGAVRESRIADRVAPEVQRDSSLKIKIELDLEVEVDLYARVKGDISIGLM